MKQMKLFAFFLLFSTLSSIPVQGQDIQDDLIAGFRSGYVDGIAIHLNDNVELSIKGIDNVFTKQQTKAILNDFFRKNPPLRFKVLHKGNNDNSQFVIGQLETSTGSYRVYYLIKKNLIQQLRIEESNE